MKGFHGNVLRVDLSRGSIEKQPLDASLLRRCLGGVGLGVRLLLDHSAERYDPLAAEAPLVFAFAPLVGSALNTSAKAAVVSKSPLTGRLNDAMLSSGFALEGKRLGSDAIVIEGRREDWSILFLSHEGIRIEAAGDCLGLSAAEMEDRIHQRWGKEWQVAAIGPAGERQIPFALLSHDGRHAGRGGTGAVLGSKNIKAIAIRGGHATTIADPDRFTAISEALKTSSLGFATEKYRSTGTLGNLLVFNRLEILPTRNFQNGHHEKAQSLSAEMLFTENQVERTTCADCMIGCEKKLSLKKGGAPVRLEYENIFSLGSMLDIWNPQVVLEASRLCDHYGMDTISFGGTLAFAMECVEKGLLDWPEVRFQDEAVLIEAIHKTARLEAYGKDLALGSRALARKIGGGSERFAPQVKGLELPGYHPARLQTLGLGLAVGSRGADHNKSTAYDLDLSGEVNRFGLDQERIREMVDIEDQAVLMDSLILCKFVRRALRDFYGECGEMLHALTGEAFSREDLRRSATTIHHLRKIFNMRQGWSKEEDTLPDRFFLNGKADGHSGQEGIDPDAFMLARSKYYQIRGWNPEGEADRAMALME